MNLIYLFSLNLVLSLSMAGLTFAFFTYLRKLNNVKSENKNLPFVSVMVPARNEENKIRRCLESLANQNYPNYEVIAVDDRSLDSTGEIIREIAEKYPHVKFVRSEETPSGWIGKSNALYCASKHAKGDWFLFTDADTCHTPDSLKLSVSYAVENNADLISFMPVQELGSFWEKVVMPVLLGSFLCGDPLNTINDHTHNRAYAYGQYILVRRDIYETVGGHESVKDQILDDISLARLIKSRGYNITTADGQLLYKVRMYENLETLWQGWTKNLYALLECNMFYLTIILFLLNIGVFVPFVQVAYVIQQWLVGQHNHTLSVLTVISALDLTCMAAWYQRTAKHYRGVSWQHFFLLPLGSLTVTLLYIHSAFLVLSGNKVRWKGRRYVVDSSKSIKSDSVALLEQSLAVSELDLELAKEKISWTR